eukprot:GHRQ01020298.1.p1 GENE.GHRQ01020298.1~~GHRQ01020298.1.p1  ORF type:complete len:130 (-),score=36.15 GHRQ01020298.1:447-836(-)
MQTLCLHSIWHAQSHMHPLAAPAACAGAYLGSDMGKSLGNAVFGMGAAALVLTNKPSLARRAKYKLLHSTRVHVGQDDRVYRSMGIFEDDPAGARIKYTADVPMAAAKGIRAAVSRVGERLQTKKVVMA